jgi:ethanolamine ammonia-lyase small subunit
VSLPTREVLSFGVAHARARDAVHAELEVPKLERELRHDGWSEILEVASAATTRAAYLARPDWGAELDDKSRRRLEGRPRTEADLVFVVSDGLSAFAVHSHAAKLLRALKPKLEGLRVSPLVIATQARVALTDEVGQLLGARVAACLIGERPGLSTPDSLGVYLTAGPRVGRSDAERNCISNIHAAGSSYEQAAVQMAALIRAALASGLSGVSASRRPA